jgi:hypothetical protein
LFDPYPENLLVQPRQQPDALVGSPLASPHRQILDEGSAGKEKNGRSSLTWFPGPEDVRQSRNSKAAFGVPPQAFIALAEYTRDTWRLRAFGCSVAGREKPPRLGL